MNSRCDEWRTLHAASQSRAGTNPCSHRWSRRDGVLDVAFAATSAENSCPLLRGTKTEYPESANLHVGQRETRVHPGRRPRTHTDSHTVSRRLAERRPRPSRTADQ